MAQHVTEINGHKIGDRVKAKTQLGFTVRGRVHSIIVGESGTASTLIIIGERSGKTVRVVTSSVEKA